MMRKKTAAQLDREIAAALMKPARRSTPHHASKAVRFDELIRDDDPSAMQIAEDLLLEQNRAMREVTGGLRARNFTFELAPMAGPRNAWKMVQVNVDHAQLKAPQNNPGAQTWIKYSVANGPVRVTRETGTLDNLASTRRLAVATAWAIAKAIKPLPLDTDQKTIERLVDEAIDNGIGNLMPAELF